MLAEQADRLVGGADAVLVIDDTGVPKKGTLSVGVAPQYCGELGKQANCQSLVSLTLARHEVPVPVGLRLFLPKVWTDDPVRCAAAGVPEVALAPRTKPETALAEIDRVIAAGARFGCVLADAGYGHSGPFRRGLSARGLVWSIGVPRTQKVYSTKAEHCGAAPNVLPRTSTRPAMSKRMPHPGHADRPPSRPLRQRKWRKLLVAALVTQADVRARSLKPEVTSIAGVVLKHRQREPPWIRVDKTMPIGFEAGPNFAPPECANYFTACGYEPD